MFTMTRTEVSKCPGERFFIYNMNFALRRLIFHLFPDLVLPNASLDRAFLGEFPHLRRVCVLFS